MAKPVFGALLIWGHRNIEPGRLGSRSSPSSSLLNYAESSAVHIRDYDEGPSYTSGTQNLEKAANGHNTGVTTDGATTSGATV